MNDDARESAPRLVASVWLFRGARVLMLQRPDGAWSPPGGLVEPGETLLEAVVRETFEETALVLRESPEVLHDYVSVGRSGLRLHIHQFIALCPEGDVVISDEHRGYQWIELDVIEASLSSPLAGVSPEAEQLLLARKVAVTRARDWLARSRYVPRSTPRPKTRDRAPSWTRGSGAGGPC